MFLFPFFISTPILFLLLSILVVLRVAYRIMIVSLVFLVKITAFAGWVVVWIVRRVRITSSNDCSLSDRQKNVRRTATRLKRH